MTDHHTTTAMLAVDWGGTWCRAALVDRNGDILWGDRRTNPRGGDTGEYLAHANALLSDALAVGGIQTVGIGVAVAGPVDPESGILYQPPNLMPLDGVSLKQVWGERFGLPVVLGNDANLAAMGEYHYGAGRDALRSGHPLKSLFYVTISTGIGGGAVEGGTLLLGANGLTAEVGHTTVDTAGNAPLCQCGKRGCLEAISSGTAISNFALASLAESRYSGSSLASIPPEELTARAVVEAAMSGDALAVSTMDRCVEGLGIGLANAVHLFNPDLVILGGGVSAGLRDLNLFPRIREAIEGRLMSELHKAFELVPSVLGDNSGILGAAAAAWAQAGES